MNEEGIFVCTGENGTFLKNILRRKANLIGYTLRNYLLHDTIEGQMMELKGVGRRRKIA